MIFKEQEQYCWSWKKWTTPGKEPKHKQRTVCFRGNLWTPYALTGVKRNDDDNTSDEDGQLWLEGAIQANQCALLDNL